MLITPNSPSVVDECEQFSELAPLIHRANCTFLITVSELQSRRNADGFMNAQRRYEASREALRRYAKMLTVVYVDLRGSGCALAFGDPPVEPVGGPRGEFMMYMWGE